MGILTRLRKELLYSRNEWWRPSVTRIVVMVAIALVTLLFTQLFLSVVGYLNTYLSPPKPPLNSQKSTNSGKEGVVEKEAFNCRQYYSQSKEEKQIDFEIQIHPSLPPDRVLISYRGDFNGSISFGREEVKIESSSDFGGLDPSLNFIVCDMNFDGYLDLGVKSTVSGASNSIYHWFLFNRRKGKFLFHEGLSRISNPGVNAKAKVIYEYWQNGKDRGTSNLYKFNRGKLQLISSKTGG